MTVRELSMKGRFNLIMSIKNGEINFWIKCCEHKMKDTDGKSKHWNDNPVNWRCEICGKWLRTNFHNFYDPKQSGFEMLEMKT